MFPTSAIICMVAVMRTGQLFPLFLWGFKPNYRVAASALQVLHAATISEHLHCS